MLQRGAQADDEVVAGHPYQLTLFGNFALYSNDGRPVAGLGRKSKGLIAYLALTSGVSGRDELAALLWDRRGIEQARASLRQACYELRHALPVDAPLLAFDRDEIRLIRANLNSDIDDLASSAGGFTGALTPSRGELLRDLNGLSPAFDDWLRTERSRRCDERRAVAVRAAREALGSRRWTDAKDIACSLLTLDPTDEEAVEIALRAIGESGDIEDAQALYSRHTNALLHDLDVTPRPANAALFKGLTEARTNKRPHPRPARASGAFADAWRLPVHDDRVQAGTKRRHGVIALVLGIAAMLLIAGAMRFRHAAPAAALALVNIEPLAVAAGDEQAEAVSAGLRSSVVQKLAGSDTAAEIVDEAPATGAPVALTLRGNSLNDRGQLRANLELVAAPSGQVIWAGSFDRPVAELDQFEEQLSLQVARELHCAYADGREPYFTRDVEFARLTLAHCDSLGRDFDEAARFDAQLTRMAPGFARGWAEYAVDTAIVAESQPPPFQQDGYHRAIALARHALALDPKQGLAYAALIQANQSAPWLDRAKMAARGVAAEPTNAEIHSWHAGELAAIGRLDDALRESEVAYRYDHFLPGKIMMIGQLQTVRGNFDDVADELAIGRKYWPGHPWFDYLAFSLGMAGRHPADALKLLAADKIRADPPHAAVLRAFLAWRIAQTPATNAVAANAIQAAARHGEVTSEEVQLLATLGRLDSAYRLAGRLPGGPNNDWNWFGPDLARFRADPRFMPFAARLGLAQIWRQSGLWPDFCVQGGLSKCRADASAALAA